MKVRTLPLAWNTPLSPLYEDVSLTRFSARSFWPPAQQILGCFFGHLGPAVPFFLLSWLASTESSHNEVHDAPTSPPFYF